MTNVQIGSKKPTTSSPKPPRDIYDLLGWEVVFTGLTDYPYLNGEPGFATDYGKTGHGLLRVRVDSARAKMKGGPALLDCDFANLIAIKKGDPALFVQEGQESNCGTRRRSRCFLFWMVLLTLVFRKGRHLFMGGSMHIGSY